MADCGNTLVGQPCVLGAEHEPPLHRDVDGNTWAMHLPYVLPTHCGTCTCRG